MIRPACLVVAAAVVLSPAVAAPPVTATAFAPDGKSVLVGSQAGLEILSWPDLKPVGKLDTDLAHVHDLAFSPDGTRLLVAGGEPAESGIVEIFDWPEQKRSARVAGYRDLVYRVAWAPDGKYWAAASADHTCRVHAAGSGKELVRYEGHSRPVLAIDYPPDGKTIMSAGVDQTIQVWDAATGKPIRTLDNHVGAVNDLAVRPAEAAEAPTMLASVSDDRTVRLWQPTIGRLVRFAKLDSAPRAVAWSRNGTRLVVGCTDGTIAVLDPDSLENTAQKRVLDGRLHTLARSRDKKDVLLVGGSDGSKTRLELPDS